MFVFYRDKPTKDNFPTLLDWSPDGKHILTKLGERPVLIAVADGSIQGLAIENPGMICFSPDGKYIAYDAPQVKDADQRDVYVHVRETQSTSLLVQHPSDDRLLGWSPDGKYVLFTSDRRGTKDAWLIAVAGVQPHGDPMLVRSDISGLGDGVGFTRTGAFFFSNWGQSLDIYSTRLDIQTGKLLSQPVEAAGSYVGSNWGPDFSRDGKSLAYVNGKGGIVIQSLETTEKKLIKSDAEIRRSGRMYPLRWTSDGKAFVSTGVDRQGRKGLLRIDSFTGQTTLLVESDSAMMPPFDLSPDGKKIYYISDPLGSSLFVWDSESGQKRQLVGKDVWSLAVSPNSEQLAYFSSSDLDEPKGLFVMPSAGGEPKLVVEAADNRGAVTWSPDGRQLLYAIASVSSAGEGLTKLKYELWHVSSQGGEPQQLGLTVDGILMSLRIHPDGQQIVYGTLRSSPEIWVMENFLPK
jgi:Tol biopolymer transport system component